MKINVVYDQRIIDQIEKEVDEMDSFSQLFFDYYDMRDRYWELMDELVEGELEELLPEDFNPAEHKDWK